MNKKGKFPWWKRVFSHVSEQEKINFARHLSLTIKSGMPLLESLKIVEKQTQSGALKRAIGDIISSVEGGQFLAQGMEKHRNVFSDFFISIVHVGEQSGTLFQNLLYLADEMKKAKELKNKIRSAMIYPIVIFTATIGITALLTFSVFPKVLPIFSSLRIELPITTKILIVVFNFLLNYWWTLIVALVLVIVVLRIALRFQPVKYVSNMLLFYTPIVSSLTVGMAMSNFTRTMAVLLKSGVKIVEAVSITAYTLNNLVYRRILLQTADDIRKGEQFVNILNKNKKFFPYILLSLIEIGENTGNLEENLFYLSDYYAEEVQLMVSRLTELLEPALLVFMGLIVGFVALSIITPIYEVTSSIR